MGSRENPRSLALNYQSRHRAVALEKQASARRETVRARRLALASASDSSQASTTQEAEGEEVSSPTRSPQAPSSRRAAASGREAYAQQLMLPEWMLEVPADLATNWYVAARPEGVRCLVIASRGLTTARLRNGVVHARFASALPGGSPETTRGEDSYCLLDCVHHVADATYYALDAMAWNGHPLYHCTTEFRAFWTASKLAEAGPGRGGGAALPQFAPVPWLAADAAGLAAAYGGAAPYARDGLAFLHREAHYTPGQSPLSLLWKDQACSKYVIDTDAAGVPLPAQRLVLAYRMDGSVATGDVEPCALGRMPPGFQAGTGRGLGPGTLLRFELGPGGFTLLDGCPVGADLRLLGVAGARRGRADTLSKVLFQHLARTCPLTYAELAAAAGAAPGGDAGNVVAPGAASDMVTGGTSEREWMETEGEESTPASSMQQG
uniref:Snurportin-1 n=1 Tax=Auxenochlorella protothecoides TaxID=3075 RepID=A0A1D1ZPW4_AUXPR